MGNIWCNACAAKVTLVNDPICNKCGLPKRADADCVACRAHAFAFDAARAWAVYRTELRTAILGLKRRQQHSLGAVFSSHLADLFRSQDWQVDLVTPIPLAPSRLRERGYNQVDMLARPLAVALKLPYLENALVRSHETEPQFELNTAQRWENLRGAFQADPAPMQGMRVLVIDDIMTTGATMDAAAEALKTAGARRMYALTLTRALFEPTGSIW